jgi:hypothetical protein
VGDPIREAAERQFRKLVAENLGRGRGRTEFVAGSPITGAKSILVEGHHPRSDVVADVVEGSSVRTVCTATATGACRLKVCLHTAFELMDSLPRSRLHGSEERGATSLSLPEWLTRSIIV